MKRATQFIVWLAAVFALAAYGPMAPAASLVSYVTVPVGNAGNAADAATGFGAVGYDYRIGKYEVTNAQYTAFLNDVDPNGANTLALYSTNMTTLAVGGINFTSGNIAGTKYSTKAGQANDPVIDVSWYDAIRFANWMQNGQSGPGTTEGGAYTIGSAVPNPAGGLSISRNPGATWFLPTQDEWYKAAYYDPRTTAQGGVSGNYWSFPTKSNVGPVSDQPPGAIVPANSANFYKDDSLANGANDGYAVTGSPAFNAAQDYLTPVGSYGSAVSFYNTLDQGGNVQEWNESLFNSGTTRGTRGGSWNRNDVFTLNKSTPTNHGPFDGSFETDEQGFRLATFVVPEPGSMALFALGMTSCLLCRWRRKRVS